MNKLQTLQAFWSGFGIPAFDENSVPDEKERIALYGAAFPYITYDVTVDSFGYSVAQTASLWYRSTSWQDITEKEMQIDEFIGRGGRMIAYDGGAMWIKKANPWAQRLSGNDDSIRRIVLNLEIQYVD